MILVSLTHYSTLTGPLQPDIQVWRREPDQGATGARKLAALVLRSTRLAWRARRFDTVVAVTAGVELFVLAALLPRGRVVAADWLIPASRRLDRLWPLSRVRGFVVVRRSDIATLGRRFGVPANRCTFAPFPVTVFPEAAAEGDDGYVYSAGWAHRDWGTLIAALGEAGLDALLSMPQKVEAPANVRVVNQLTTAQGREWLRRARTVALAFVDTELPSGPLVLLDAMAHGKAIVVSDVGGTRDYVTDGETALVVPPGDVAALAAALRRLDREPELRDRLGRAAKARTLGFDEAAFWSRALPV